MPRLSELTIYGPLLISHHSDNNNNNHNHNNFNVSSTIISLALTVFPSLKRLRMGNFQGLLPTDFLPQSAISMPQLTHISIFQPLPVHAPRSFLGTMDHVAGDVLAWRSVTNDN